MFATWLEARRGIAPWLTSLCLVACSLGDDDDDLDCQGACVGPSEVSPVGTAEPPTSPEPGTVVGGAPATPSTTFTGGADSFGGLGGGFGTGGRLFGSGGSSTASGGALFATGGSLFGTGGATSFGFGGTDTFGD